jgi:hypothetical protein
VQPGIVFAEELARSLAVSGGDADRDPASPQVPDDTPAEKAGAAEDGDEARTVGRHVTLARLRG